MAQLTEDQVAFIKEQNLTVEDFFDGSDLSKRDRAAKMEAANKRFYYGGFACAKAGHTLRAKAGHCIQCDTRQIAYATRYSRPGLLYVAGSLAGRCVKIGTAEDFEARLIRLRSEGYGGFSDWRMLAVTKTVDRAGEIEATIQSRLTQYKRDAPYAKAGVVQEARELFACNFPIAAQAMISVVSGAQVRLLCDLDTAKQYEWTQ